MNGCRISEWEGFKRRDFEVDGISSLVVEPDRPLPGRPWYWRMRFFGAFPYPDIELLRRGWAVATTDVADLYGSEEAVRRCDNFHRHMVAAGYSSRCVAVGYSRGGLIACNWGRRNPDKVACIYLDNPVCDFKSWPGGKGTGPGATEDWRKCLAAYGLTEAEAMTWPGNPVDNVAELAAAHTPVLIVCGDSDKTVPPAENTIPFAERLRAAGGEVTVIWKPGAEHHPHSLENPAPIVDFVERSIR